MKLSFKSLIPTRARAKATKSPVYEFFAEASAHTKAKAYRKALRSASSEQASLLARYNKLSKAQ